MRSCAHGPNGDEKFSGGGLVASVAGNLGPSERACNSNGWNKELLRLINNWSWWSVSVDDSGGGLDALQERLPTNRYFQSFPSYYRLLFLAFGSMNYGQLEK